MKILGRIALILAVFGLVMGVTYAAVNARSSSVQGGAPAFEQGNGRFVLPDGTRPDFRGWERNEFRGGHAGGGILFGAIKNIAVIGIIVALIVVPKSWSQRRKRTAQSAA